MDFEKLEYRIKIRLEFMIKWIMLVCIIFIRRIVLFLIGLIDEIFLNW